MFSSLVYYNLPLVSPTVQYRAQASDVSEPRTEAGSELFPFQDSGLSQIFILFVSTSETMLNNTNAAV